MRLDHDFAEYLWAWFHPRAFRLTQTEASEVLHAFLRRQTSVSIGPALDRTLRLAGEAWD